MVPGINLAVTYNFGQTFHGLPEITSSPRKPI